MATTYTARSAQTPNLPTEEMIQAGFDAMEEYERWIAERVFPRPILVAHIWESMQRAAPSRANEMNLDLDGGRNG